VRELGADAAADEATAATGHDDGNRFDRAVREQHFLCVTATVRERLDLPVVEGLAFCRQLVLDHVGQCEVHVVAAEQDVVADGHAGELQ